MTDYMCPADPTVTHCYHAAKVNEIICAHTDTIAALRAEVERFKVSLSDAVRQTQEQADDITALRAENEKLRADLHLAVTSDSEYCATIDRINAALLDAPTVDIDVVVPYRDYSTMTPKDCYEAGLLDGVYQAREAIKAAARAALEKKDG